MECEKKWGVKGVQGVQGVDVPLGSSHSNQSRCLGEPFHGYCWGNRNIQTSRRVCDC